MYFHTALFIAILIRRRCGPQVGPDQRVRRGVHLEGMKRGRTAYQDGLMKAAKDVKWLKMLIYN
jgi:hypothetical protein